MMPMMGDGMNPDVGPPHPGMMNKKHFPPGEKSHNQLTVAGIEVLKIIIILGTEKEKIEVILAVIWTI